MKLKLLDAETGAVADIDDAINAFQWAENNWSCDCNRVGYFDPDYMEKDDDICRSERYLIIAVYKTDRDYYTLRDYNSGYPDELLTRYNITNESPLDGSGVIPWNW
jgi:hypothetical protein